jgi:hypothetical protein
VVGITEIHQAPENRNGLRRGEGAIESTLECTESYIPKTPARCPISRTGTQAVAQKGVIPEDRESSFSHASPLNTGFSGDGNGKRPLFRLL